MDELLAGPAVAVDDGSFACTRESATWLAESIVEKTSLVEESRLREAQEREWKRVQDAYAENAREREELRHLQVRLRDVEAERDRLRAALVESHGSYESLRAVVRPLDADLAERAAGWDGPICARAALASPSSPAPEGGPDE